MGAEAAQCYKKAIAGLGDTAGLYNSLAAAYAGAGDLQQARAARRKVLALEPGTEQAARNLEKLLAALQESQ